MKSVVVDENYENIQEIERLYDASFPYDERIPFERLMNTRNEERIMHVYYEDYELVGMSYLFFNDDLIYLSYICVEEELRDNGYGSKILSVIRKNYPEYRIVLDIEEVAEDNDNYKERKRRKDFYLRNDYKETGIYYRIYGVDYELLSCNGNVLQSEWHDMIRKHWGKYADTAVYKTKKIIFSNLKFQKAL